jgi:hypothetical protein
MKLFFAILTAMTIATAVMPSLARACPEADQRQDKSLPGDNTTTTTSGTADDGS